MLLVLGPCQICCTHVSCRCKHGREPGERRSRLGLDVDMDEAEVLLVLAAQEILRCYWESTRKHFDALRAKSHLRGARKILGRKTHIDADDVAQLNGS